MPFHKKSSSQNLKDDYQIRNRQYQHIQQQQQQQDNKQEQEQDDEEEVDEVEGNEERGGEDSADQSPSSSADDDKDEDEYLYLDLAEFRKEVECPICLGIIRKTRTVMECLHRFCRDCIDKSMRLGNNECPACRTHCASRRSLRDDPNYDALIAALFPDIDKYEAEELAFGEEERTRNKNIQESITQTLRRQSEALGKKTTTTPVTRRRGRTRMNQTTNTEASEENIDRNGGSNSNGGGRGSSSSDEQYTDTKQKRVKRRTRRNSSPTSSTPADINSEVNNENPFLASPAFPGSREVPTWGKGGTRSQTRNRMARGGNSKNTASNSELNSTNYLQTVDDQKHEV